MFRCRAIKRATWKQCWKVDQRGERCHDIWPCLHKEKWVGIQKQRAWKEQEEGAWNIFCLEFLCGHEVKDERYMEGCCWNQSYSTYCVSAHHNINLHTNNTPLHLQTACSAHTSPSHYCGEQVHSQVTLVVIQCQVISLLLLQNESIVVAVAG